MEFNVGDTVRIINRLSGNYTGSVDFDKPGGDVGKIGRVMERISSKGRYKIYGYDEFGNDRYLGYFTPGIEIELVNSKEPNYEIY